MNHLLRLCSLPHCCRLVAWLVSTLAAVSLLAACAWHASKPDSDSLRSMQVQSWQGEVSCPGCNERWLTLTLFPDGLFRLRETYVAAKGANEERFHDVGRWSVMLSDSRRLVLQGASQRQVRLLSNGDLTLLDAAGREIVSIRDYRLVRLGKPDPIADPMRLLALYGGDGSNAVLTECLTAQVLSLADTPAALALRQAAASLPAERRARGPVLAAMMAHWEDGKTGGTSRRLVVDQFDRLWPNETCAQGPIAPSQPLVETLWHLLSINGVSAQEAVLGQPAHLLLRKGGRMTGSTGCNRLQGSWQVSSDKLGISRISSSRASCHETIMLQEHALMEALRNTKQYRQVGSQLELLQGDQVLARFVATEML